MNDLNDNKKKNVIANIKASFSGRKLRSGAYVTVMSAVVIVIILVVNMLFTKINLQVDLSSQNFYTLTKDTKNLEKDLKDDVTIYYLVQSGKESDLFKNILKQYDTASDKVKVVYKDPVLYPKFAKQYTDETIKENSFLVVNDKTKKAKYVDYDDVLVKETNYQTGEESTTGIDVEGELTAAIQNVTSSINAKMYIVDGHGEQATGDNFKELIKKMNVSSDTLKTVSVSSVPKDCKILFINAPQSDFTDTETKMIKDYLMAGGKAIISVDYNAEKLPNLLSILKYYGIEMVNGIVLESDTNMHMNEHVNYLMPNVETNAITSLAKDNNVPVFMPNASGLKISDQKRTTLKIEPLLTTSASSYSKVNMESQTVDKEKDDIAGPFNLGLVATDTFNKVTSSIIVYGSAYTFTQDTAQYANSAVLTGSIGNCIGEQKLLSIPTKNTTDAQLTFTSNQVITLGATIVIFIPIAILIFGGVICYKRRRK